MYSDEDQELPEILEVFQRGIVIRQTPPQYSSHYDPDSYLPEIPGVFNRGYIETEEQIPAWHPFPLLDREDNLANIPIEQLETASYDVSIQPLTYSESQYTESTPIHPHGSRFQRYFEQSVPTDTRETTFSSIKSSGLTPIKGRGNSFGQSNIQQSFDSGVQNPSPGLSYGSYNLFGSQPNQSSQQFPSTSDIWAQNILGTTPQVSQSGHGSDQSYLGTFNEYSASQSTTPYLEDWTQSIFGQTVTQDDYSWFGIERSPHPVREQQDIYENCKSIDEDLRVMSTLGFIFPLVEFKKKRYTGAIFEGYYGQDILYLTDIKGRPFTHSDSGKQFIVKYFEYKENDPMSEVKREMFEIERYVLTFADHPNVLSIRYAFNMGHKRECKYRHNPQNTFTSWNRMYLILDFSDLGDLENYLEDNILSEELCKSFIIQLYSGLKHLHDSYIFHGDIEPRNILLFSNWLNIVVKWCDFSLSSILDGTHPSQPNQIQTDRINGCIRYDLESLSKVFLMILMFSQSSGESSKCIQQLIDVLRVANDLNEIKQMIDYLRTE